VVALLGRNGAGKTTLLRVAMGMLRASAGSVRVLGLDPRRQPVELKRRIGYVAEEQVLPTDLSIAAVLDLHRQLFPTWDRDLEARLRERFDLSPKSRIGALSKGQARQVALICAVAHRPELLVLDEPAAGLDPAARREILEEAIALLGDQGSTVLFSSHHMADVERIAGRVVLLHDGGVLLDADLDTLRESYSLAVIPVNGTQPEAIRGAAGCVRVSRRGSMWHAVFARMPQDAQSVLQKHLGITNAACRTIPLEDLFVELVGERS
jgi:ABC-2 type transport system ATP-binding protein